MKLGVILSIPFSYNNNLCNINNIFYFFLEGKHPILNNISILLYIFMVFVKKRVFGIFLTETYFKFIAVFLECFFFFFKLQSGIDIL